MIHLGLRNSKVCRCLFKSPAFRHYIGLEMEIIPFLNFEIMRSLLQVVKKRLSCSRDDKFSKLM